MMAALVTPTSTASTTPWLSTTWLGFYQNGGKRTSLSKQPDDCQVLLLWQRCKNPFKKDSLVYGL